MDFSVCLKSGHRSKVCDNRSVCDICERRHPTCLHEDRSKAVGKQRITESSKERSTEPSQDKHIKVLAEATSNRVVQDISNTRTS